MDGADAQKMLDDHYYGKSDHPRAFLLDNSRGQWLGRKGKRKLANAREYIHSWMKAGQITQQQGVEALSRNSLQEVSNFWGITDLNVPKDKSFYEALPDHSRRHLANRYEHIGNNHFEVHVFRNTDVCGGKPLATYSTRTSDAGKIEINGSTPVDQLTYEYARELGIRDFIQLIRAGKNQSRSSITDHEFPVRLMSSIYQSYCEQKTIKFPLNFEIVNL